MSSVSFTIYPQRKKVCLSLYIWNQKNQGPTDEELKCTAAVIQTHHHQTQNERRETTYQMLTQIGENHIGMGC